MTANEVGFLVEDGHGNTWSGNTCVNSPTEAEIAGWKCDALRYRWLKEHHLQLGPDCWIRSGDDLDEAIDAEMRAGPQEGVGRE